MWRPWYGKIVYYLGLLNVWIKVTHSAAGGDSCLIQTIKRLQR